ncbi:unnamed protein product, partial [Vitis vinifera]
MKRVGSRLRGWRRDGGAAAAERYVESRKVRRNRAGSSGRHNGRLGLLQKPLYSFTIRLVAQFSSQLKNPRGTDSWHTDAPSPAVDLGVAVLGGPLDRRGRRLRGCRSSRLD